MGFGGFTRPVVDAGEIALDEGGVVVQLLSSVDPLGDWNVSLDLQGWDGGGIGENGCAGRQGQSGNDTKS